MARIVVLGAGFAGLWAAIGAGAARNLAGREVGTCAAAEVQHRRLWSFNVSDDALVLDVRDQFIRAGQQTTEQG